MSDSVRPHRRQPTRLPHPWDSSGKNTGVGCHFLLQCMKVKRESEVSQSCPTLSDPMDCSLPGSSIHGIFQARALEWGAIAFSVIGPYWLSIFYIVLIVTLNRSFPFYRLILGTTFCKVWLCSHKIKCIFLWHESAHICLVHWCVAVSAQDPVGVQLLSGADVSCQTRTLSC